jgi:hypothetical protein
MARYLRILILLVPVIVLLAIYAPTHNFFHHQYDDSYITYRYAINLAQGHGLVFNVGERTDAASSFLYALVLSCCWLLHLRNLELVGGLIGVLSLGFISIIVYKLAAYISSDKRAALLVAVACGLNGLLAGWTLSGMETLPWAALVLLAVYLMVIDAHPVAISLAIAAAAFTRFEGIFLVVPYLILIVTQSKSKKRLVPMGGVILAFALFYIVKHAYYGVWISHAFQMKEVAVYYRPAPRELIHFWIRFVSVPLLLSAPALLSRKYGFVLAYIALSIISVALGPRSDWSRYSVHLLPLLYAFSAPALAAMLVNYRAWTRVTALVLVIFAMFAQALAAERFNWRNMSDLADAQMCRENLGRYINTHIDKGEYIASSDLGAIAYVAIDHRFVDLIALTSADILARYRAGETADTVLEAMHVRYIADTYDPATPMDRLNVLLEEFPGVKRKSKFAIDSHHPAFACRTSGDLEFILTNIVLRKDQ